MERTELMERMKRLLGDGKQVFPCVGDLIENGLRLSSFSPGESAPGRQEVTQYLAAWCKFAGLDENTCRTWLTDYAVRMLSSISKSSPGAIRHSTKSNVKYIYRDDIPFRCEREKNQFRARCSGACPVYAQQGQPVEEKKSAPAAPFSALADDDAQPAGQVKERFRAQFEASMDLVRREVEKGTKKKLIVDMLNEQGMTTRTGRRWTYPILTVEISRLGKWKGDVVDFINLHEPDRIH